MTPSHPPATWLTALREHCAQHGQRRTATVLGLSQATVSLCTREVYMADTKTVAARVATRLPAPAWLTALRAEVARTNQTRTAARLGLSDGTVSQVLSGTYGASTLRIERRIRGELLGETCECPVLHDPSLRVCQDVQERDPKATANPQHQQAWFACRGRGRFERVGTCPQFNGAGASKPVAILISPRQETTE